MNLPIVIFALHVGCTLYMTGLIWFVQLVHYPLMGSVGADGYTEYQQAHMRRTTWAVAPAMLGEVGTSIALLFLPLPIFPLELAFGGIALIALIWISTASLQVPSHSALLRGFDSDAHRKLVRSNWIRTIAWTARSVLLLYVLADALG